MMRFLVSALANLLVWIFICALLFAGAVGAIFFNPELTRKAAQFAANEATEAYLAHSVQLEKAHFDSAGRVMIEGIRAAVQTSKGPVHLMVKRVYSRNCVLDFFKNDGLVLAFENARFQGSNLSGVSGTLRIKGIQNWWVDLSAKIDGIGFEEVTWINPDQLHGTTGNLVGTLDFHAEKSKEPLLDAELEIKAPGGVMQTQLIRYLFQYLPPVSIRPEVEKMVREQGLVPYSNASIMTQMEASDRIKVFLFISIPDYNFNLNTNVEIRIDKKNAFGQIAQIFGLIKAGHS